jgi:DNA-binding MarR family transcriptional regulator
MSTPMRADASTVYRRYLSAVILHGQASAEAMGLNATDMYALNCLELAGPMTSGELAERTGLTTGATTRLIDRLERGGHVRRTTDPADRRKVIIELVSTSDSKTIGRAVGPARRLVGEIIQGYGKRELDVLFDYFERAAAAYEEATRELAAARRSTSRTDRDA